MKTWRVQYVICTYEGKIFESELTIRVPVSYRKTDMFEGVLQLIEDCESAGSTVLRSGFSIQEVVTCDQEGTKK